MSSMGGADVAEYLANMRALVQEKPLFATMVERQVQARLLPALSGSRAALEQPLWALLVFCLDGPASATPTLDANLLERASAAATAGAGLDQPTAVFPDAARAVLRALVRVREHGVYPPPRC